MDSGPPPSPPAVVARVSATTPGTYAATYGATAAAGATAQSVPPFRQATPMQPEPPQPLAQQQAQQQTPMLSVAVVLPARLPAQCFMSAALDYRLPPIVLAAIVKVETRGRPLVATNSNGTQDVGISGLNTASWAKYMVERYGISMQALISDACQNIRAAAYALRFEQNHKSCAGRDIWCGVGRYHAPNNPAASSMYVVKVSRAMQELMTTGRFD